VDEKDSDHKKIWNKKFGMWVEVYEHPASDAALEGDTTAPRGQDHGDFLFSREQTVNS
jgi:hypothetical protein